MGEAEDSKKARVQAKIAEIRRDYAEPIAELLREINRSRLGGRGYLTAGPAVEGNALRWTLAWKEKRKVSFELNIVANIEDDGQSAKIGRVWVHRHASTTVDYDGHTPTTRMRRLTALSLPEIKQAIDAEWG